MFLLRKEKWGVPAPLPPVSKEGRSIKGRDPLRRPSGFNAPRKLSAPSSGCFFRASFLEVTRGDCGEHLPRGFPSLRPAICQSPFLSVEDEGKRLLRRCRKRLRIRSRSFARQGKGEEVVFGTRDITPTSCNGRWKDAKTLKAFFFFFSRHPRLSKDWCTRVDNMFLLFREK